MIVLIINKRTHTIEEIRNLRSIKRVGAKYIVLTYINPNTLQENLKNISIDLYTILIKSNGKSNENLYEL